MTSGGPQSPRARAQDPGGLGPGAVQAAGRPPSASSGGRTAAGARGRAQRTWLCVCVSPFEDEQDACSLAVGEAALENEVGAAGSGQRGSGQRVGKPCGGAEAAVLPDASTVSPGFSPGCSATRLVKSRL